MTTLEKEVEASAWREGDGFFYRLQINNIDARSIRKIKRICSDWNDGGYGWSLDNKYKILLFSRTFRTKRAWLKWARQFPYKLVELGNSGKPLRNKIGSDYNKRG